MAPTCISEFVAWQWWNSADRQTFRAKWRARMQVDHTRTGGRTADMAYATVCALPSVMADEPPRETYLPDAQGDVRRPLAKRSHAHRNSGNDDLRLDHVTRELSAFRVESVKWLGTPSLAEWMRESTRAGACASWGGDHSPAPDSARASRMAGRINGLDVPGASASTYRRDLAELDAAIAQLSRELHGVG
jgi:hypothetical protein